jgi:hypothetical protein
MNGGIIRFDFKHSSKPRLTYRSSIAFALRLINNETISFNFISGSVCANSAVA